MVPILGAAGMSSGPAVPVHVPRSTSTSRAAAARTSQQRRPRPTTTSRSRAVGHEISAPLAIGSAFRPGREPSGERASESSRGGPARGVAVRASALPHLAASVSASPLLASIDVLNWLAAGVGLAVPILAVGGGFLWWRAQRRLSSDVLKLDLAKVEPNSDRELPSEALHITRFMKFNPDNVKLAPWNSVKMISGADYAAALSVPGNFNWSKAARTLLVHLGLNFLLPLANLAVKDDGKADDAFAPVGGSGNAYAVMRDSLSPLHLYAVGELTNIAASSKRSMKAEDRSMLKFLRGHEALPADLEDLPDTFIIDEQLPHLLKGLNPDAVPPRVQPPAEPTKLPGLAAAHVGLPYLTNAYQDKCGIIFAMLLNRLSANAMPDAWKPAEFQGKTMTVCVSRGSPAITTPGALIAAMQSSMGASVDMAVVSRVTGFGAGFALKQEGEWLQLPVVIPIRTGVTMLDGTAESSGTKEITTLMPHAEVMLRVSAPNFNFRISFFQGIQGFTGWHAGAEPTQPWNNGPEMEVRHSKWKQPEQYARAADVAAMVAMTTNHTADELYLPNGGYGYLGVCHDSVAIVQASLDEKVSLFPCLVGGQAEAMMGKYYTEITKEATAMGQKDRAALADKIKEAMHATPCDVLHETAGMHDVIRRVNACTPSVTPFETLERCRRDLRRVTKQLSAVGIAA